MTLPPAPGRDAEERVLRIVCTDRGSHHEELLAAYYFDHEIGDIRPYGSPHLQQWVEIDGTRSEGFGALEITCPACPRRSEFKRERWEEIVHGAWRAGFEVFDLSLIDQ